MDFDTDKEEEKESISRTLQVVALVEGYVHWDGENVCWKMKRCIWG